jgi:hypothetical protein
MVNSLLLSHAIWYAKSWLWSSGDLHGTHAKSDLSRAYNSTLVATIHTNHKENICLGVEDGYRITRYKKPILNLQNSVVDVAGSGGIHCIFTMGPLILKV